jgi:hypothetical protein
MCSSLNNKANLHADKENVKYCYDTMMCKDKVKAMTQAYEYVMRSQEYKDEMHKMKNR